MKVNVSRLYDAIIHFNTGCLFHSGSEIHRYLYIAYLYLWYNHALLPTTSQKSRIFVAKQIAAEATVAPNQLSAATNAKYIFEKHYIANRAVSIFHVQSSTFRNIMEIMMCLIKSANRYDQQCYTINYMLISA